MEISRSRRFVNWAMDYAGYHPETTLIRVRDETMDFVSQEMKARHDFASGEMQASISVGRHLTLALDRRDIKIDEIEDGIDRNPYNTLQKQVTSLRKKYLSQDDFGNILCTHIVLLRAAFVMGTGISAVIKKTKRRLEDGADNQVPEGQTTEELEQDAAETTAAQREAARQERLESRAEGERVPGQFELDFILDLIEFNSFQGFRSDTLAVQRELEGAVLMILHVVKAEGDFVNIAVEIVSWHDRQYHVVYNRLDGRENPVAGIDVVWWDDKETKKRVEISGERAVFLPFGALPDGKEGVPTLAPVIRDMDEHDRNEREFDRMNRYNANPTKEIQWENSDQAKEFHEKLEGGKASFRWGRVFNHNAKKFEIHTMDGTAHESYDINIRNKVRNISAATGIPTLLLGYPDLMSNRSTADFAQEPMSIIGEQERKVWIDGLKSLYDKAIRLRADNVALTEPALEEGLIEPVIPFVTSQELKIIKDIFGPLAKDGILPVEALLQIIPIARLRGDELIEMRKKEMEERRQAAPSIPLLTAGEFPDAASAASTAGARDLNTDSIGDTPPPPE